MKNTNKFLLVVIVALISGLFAYRITPPKITPTVKSATISQEQSFSVEQKISYGNLRPAESTNIKVAPGSTVLDILISTKTPEIKEYSFGKAVEAIDGIRNGQDKKYWLYSVNGLEANIGAADYKLSNNDIVVWELK